MTAEYALIFINWAICTFGGWLCVCRMTKMSSSTTKMEIRLQYMIWFVFFTASGWSFITGDDASPVQILMSLCVLGALAIGVPAWRFTLPQYARRV